jgi:hypothetical protein
VHGSQEGKTTEYAFTLKRDFLRGLVAALSDSELSALVAGEDDASLRQIERMVLTRSTVKLGLSTDGTGFGIASTVEASLRMPEQSINGSAKVSFWKRFLPLAVRAPENAVPAETFFGSLDRLDDMVPWLRSGLPEPSYDPYDATEPGEWIPLSDEPDCASDLSALRKGLCGSRPARTRN